MTITALPPAPSRTDPSTFSAKADALLGALATFVTEANTLESNVNAKEASTISAASTATTKASEASSSASTATTKASEATTARNEAVNLVLRYQGALSSDPSVNKTGGALVAGDWYVNSSTGYIRAYNGSSWVQGISVIAGVTSVNGELGALTNYVKTTGDQTISSKTYSANKYTETNSGNISGGTLAIDYNNGPIIKATIAAAVTSITISNLPASGTVGHLKLMLVNPGAYAITFPASWKFIKSDFTVSTFSGLGITLPASGVVFFDLITDDSGTNVYVTLSRN